MKKPSIDDCLLFWNTARLFIDCHLADRKMSDNTVNAYRFSLNSYMDFLELQKGIPRKGISFKSFSKALITEYLELLQSRNLAAKTCNLRLTAILSLLDFASSEEESLTAVYLDACKIKSIRTVQTPIEFFEATQMKAILAAPDISTRIGRRNQMILILMYDSAARISEVADLRVESLHLDAAVPYVQILGKGRKYRNVPLMDRTVEHLRRYLREFHPERNRDSPLFFSVNGKARHKLSTDSIDLMLKKSAGMAAQSKGIEMPKSVHCHMIRKTRAMDLYQAGLPLPHIQQLLGHENISTTSGFYAFATLDTIANAMEKAKTSSAADGLKKWSDKDLIKQILRL
jgi:integrase/recombinase XerD